MKIRYSKKFFSRESAVKCFESSNAELAKYGIHQTITKIRETKCYFVIEYI